MPANKTQTAKKVARQQLAQKRLATGPDPRAAAARAKVRADQIKWARSAGGTAGEAAARAKYFAQDAATAKRVAIARGNMTRVANTPIAPAPNYQFERRVSSPRTKPRLSKSIPNRFFRQ